MSRKVVGFYTQEQIEDIVTSVYKMWVKEIKVLEKSANKKAVLYQIDFEKGTTIYYVDGKNEADDFNNLDDAKKYYQELSK